MTDTHSLVALHGMVPWHGGETQPADWNGGRFLLADGTIYHPNQNDDEPDWQHYTSETGCLEPGCIVGYARGVAANRPADDGERNPMVDREVNWLVHQLEAWPNRVDPDRTTNIQYLMQEAAKVIRRTPLPPHPEGVKR